MQIHLISIGGAVMHNLAIALKKNGFRVSGSDDEIFEPSLSRLKQYALLPSEFGWFPQKIHKGLDAVILGMHARADNPELLEAQKLGLSIYSFPEYIYEQAKKKDRIAVCGSHGKTTITSMILHCFLSIKKKFDYLVGAQLKGFDAMVQISDADIMVIEGDEYFASPIDKRPKFLFYHPKITLLSGIAWDHFNVFPKWEDYLFQFQLLVESLEKDSYLIYNAEDENILQLLEQSSVQANCIPYKTPNYNIINEQVHITNAQSEYAFYIFGKHNLQNMEAAKQACLLSGVKENIFYESMQTFSGASRRLEEIFRNDSLIIYRDFAHAPSKVKATVSALKEQYPQKKLIAVFELHTFSSLNKSFLPQYSGSMNEAHVRIVYFNPHTLDMKKLPTLSKQDIKDAFHDDELIVLNHSEEISSWVKESLENQSVILLMSSGNFDNLDVQVFF